MIQEELLYVCLVFQLLFHFVDCWYNLSIAMLVCVAYDNVTNNNNLVNPEMYAENVYK